MPRTTKIEQTCNFCFVKFNGFPTQKGRSGKRFCSVKCRHLADVKLSPTIECKFCKKIVKRTKTGIQIYCSKECYWSTLKGRALNYTPAPRFGDKNPRWRKDRDVMIRDKKLANSCRSFLNRTLVLLNIEKKGRTFEVLGYLPLELKQHLERLFKPGMNWTNHGRGEGKWQIDHIRPIISFPSTTPINIINALSNLQPLWWKENSDKRAKWNPAS